MPKNVLPHNLATLHQQLITLQAKGIFGDPNDQLILDAIDEFVDLVAESSVQSINITPMQKIMGQMFIQMIEENFS